MRRLKHAQELQSQGNCDAAIPEYSAVLARVPEDQPRVISQISVHLAECQWGLGEPKAAFQTLQNALASDPENRAAHLRLGELMLSGGAPQIALEHAGWVLSRDPNDVDALTLVGGAYAALQDLGRSQAVFERIWANEPGRVNVSLTLAQIYRARGNELKARQILQQAAKVHPRESAPWLALARMEEEAGNSAAAEDNYRRAVAADDNRETKLRLAQFLARASRISEAEQLLAQADQKDTPPDSTLRADFELFLGRSIQAIGEYTSVMQRPATAASIPARMHAPDATGTTRPHVVARIIEAELALAHKQPVDGGRIEHARALLARYRAQLDAATSESLAAEIALIAGDLPSAEGHAKRALELAPESAAAYFVAGLVRHAALDLPAASNYWQTALEKDPEFLPAHQAVAAHALEVGDASAAEENIVPVIRQEPANFAALCIYARALMAKGQIHAASLIARRALSADASSAEPHLILGDLAMRQNRLPSAFIEYQQAILLEPDSARAMAALARIYRRGRITRATLLRMERVAGSPPPSASLMEVVGRLYADRGWQADAERALQKAAKLDTSRATALNMLALTYAHHGKQRAAADSLALTGDSAAQLIAGVRAAAAKDISSAIHNYEAAVRHGEQSGVAANNLAWIYAQRGIELDRALELAQLARRLAPQNPAVLDTIGFVQLTRREYSAAIETLKGAVELARAAPETQAQPALVREVKLHLAEAYLRSGQPEAAAAVKKSLP